MASADDIALFDDGQDDEPAAAPRKAKGGASADDLAMFAAPAKDPRFVDSEPARETRPLKNTGADLTGQLRDQAAANPPSKLLEHIADAATGAGTMLTNAADAATLGGYGLVRNTVAGAIAPDATARTVAAERAYNEAHPIAEAASRAAGYLTPYGAPEALAGAAGKALGHAAEAAPGVVSRVLSSRPVAGAILGGGVSGATTLGEDVTAGASPGAALYDAGKSALVGGAVSGALGLGGAALSRLAEGAEGRIADRVREKIGEGATRGKQDKLGQKADEIDSLLARHPDLEKVVSKPKQFIAHAEDLIAAKGEQQRALLDAADRKAGGGIRLGNLLDSVDGLVAKHMDGSDVATADAVARKRADMVKLWGEDPDAVIPSSKVRKFASVLQREGYGPAITAAETSGRTAAKDASKAVLDQVNQHVTGVGYADGKGSTDPLVRKYYEGNDDITALHRTVAAMEQKVSAAPSGPRNRLTNLVHGATHAGALALSAANHSPLPLLTTVGLDYGLPLAASAVDKGIVAASNRGLHLPSVPASDLGRLTANDLLRDQQDRELARRLQAQRVTQ